MNKRTNERINECSTSGISPYNTYVIANIHSKREKIYTNTNNTTAVHWDPSALNYYITTNLTTTSPSIY